MRTDMGARRIGSSAPVIGFDVGVIALDWLGVQPVLSFRAPEL